MNKKGFTLIELLGVIAIIVIIIVIMFSSVGDTVDDTKNQIAEINKNQIIDAAKVLGNELLFCDNSTTNFVLENTTCQKIKNEDYTVIVTIKQLYENGYLSNDINCDGKITINIDSNYKVNVELSDYSCDGSTNPGSNTPGGNEEPERIPLSQAVIASVGKTGGAINYGTAGYRYSGATPNNYITFNNETWRIIGVVDGSQIGKEAGTYYTKIIRNESIANAAWDNSGSNTWNTSILYNQLNSTSNYINNANVTAVDWHHTAHDNYKVPGTASYTIEGWGTTCTASSKNCTKNAKVGLMSPSDYGFAAGDACQGSQTLSGYSNGACTNTNWLFSNQNEWFLMPNVSPTNGAWFVNSRGEVGGYIVTFLRAVRPVIYLESSTTLSGGSGTSDSPFTIDVSENSGSNPTSGPETVTLSKIIYDKKGTTNEVTDYGLAGYRYSGANPNNYITFNGETWRIIGVVDGSQIGKEAGTYYTKIIRNESIGKKQWNSTQDNTWYTSSLYNTLNVASDYTYKDNANVAAVNWYHKESGNPGVLTTAQYTVEGWGTTCNASSKDCTSNAKVGIMSPSDYGYASSACYSSTNLSSYNSSTCTGSNWLYINNTWQWLLEPYASYSNRAWFVDSDGGVYYDYIYVTSSIAVRPVLYLKLDVEVVGGNGTSTSPYTIN